MRTKSRSIGTLALLIFSLCFQITPLAQASDHDWVEPIEGAKCAAWQLGHSHQSNEMQANRTELVCTKVKSKRVWVMKDLKPSKKKSTNTPTSNKEGQSPTAVDDCPKYKGQRLQSEFGSDYDNMRTLIFRNITNCNIQITISGVLDSRSPACSVQGNWTLGPKKSLQIGFFLGSIRGDDSGKYQDKITYRNIFNFDYSGCSSLTIAGRSTLTALITASSK